MFFLWIRKIKPSESNDLSITTELLRRRAKGKRGLCLIEFSFHYSSIIFICSCMYEFHGEGSG